MNAVFNYTELVNPQTNELDFKKFSISIESDYDRSIYEAIVIQSMDKETYKSFNRLARKNTASYGSCGHEWDCCGCSTGTSLNIEYLKGNVFKVTYTEGFNY